ncbi:MAG: SusC/RagA family TonB-linked outer membrane protein [Gemmatimonadaceae bacterium]
MTLLLTVLVSAEASAQRRITGRVTAATGEPVQGVNVKVQGTTIGTYTADDGRFTLINVPQGSQVVTARRIGYRREQAIVSATQDVVDFKLERDVLQLEAQVITGQATTVSTQNAANAVTVVTSAEVNRVPQPTVENALQGKVPGAVITQNSGAPGGGVQVQIRGSNTVNGAYQPLYVVDGVIVNNSSIQTGLNSITGAGGGITASQDQMVNRVADLNPEDIETVEILKGPSAGAIYGSRGANGVVVITTKRGQTGRPSLNVVQRLGTQALAKKYELRCFTFAEAVPVAASFGVTLTQQDYAGCVDPQDQLFGNHYLSYETAASLRGGSEATTYFASASVKHDGGLTQNSGYSKQSLRFNLTQALGSSLSLRGNSEILHTLTERGIFGNDNNNIAPYTVIGETPTFFDFSRRDPTTGDFMYNPYAGGINVLQNQSLIRTPEDVYRMLGNVSANWAAFSSANQTLSFDLLGGVDAYTLHGRIFSPPNTYIEQSGNISPYPGTVVDNNSDNVNANLNASIVHKYLFRWATATTSAGIRQEHSEFRQAVNRGQGLFPGITNFSTAVQTASTQNQDITRTLSYYAQEEFLALSERLLLTAAVNAERSSTNGDTAKFYAYPKFSASYNVPMLPRGVDNFKVRLAVGTAGNRVPSGFKYTTLTNLLENGIVGLRPSTTVGLSTVYPEITTETEGGFDAQFLGGRAGTEVTVYHKVTRDLVLASGLAPSTGFSVANINGGKLQNDGLEIGLNLLPIENDRLTWQSRTAFSRNRGKVLSLPVPAFYTGSGFGTRTARVKVQEGFAPDEVVSFAGFDATGARFEQHYGSASPDFTMGFSNDFTVGAFRLSTLIDWRRGGWLADLSQTYLEQGVNGQSAIAGGNLADTSMNRIDQSTYAAGFPAFLEHGSFAKLREVTLSYSLNKNLANTLFRGAARDVRLELSGRNLKTWSNYRGLDPEVSNFGNAPLNRLWDLAPYPPSRQFFFSIDANF